MNKPKPKLLAKNSRPKKKRQYHGFFRTTTVLEDGKMKSFPHTKDPEDGSKIESRFKAEFREHARNDAKITQLINERALDFIRKGKIRLVPAAFQSGPRGGKQVRWSTHVPDSGIDVFLSKSGSNAEKKRLYLDIMSQLAYLHSHAQVVHKDFLKSHDSNIILWAGKPHLSDFGLGEDIRAKNGKFSQGAKGLMLNDVDAVVLTFKDHLKTQTDLEEGLEKYSQILGKAHLADELKRKNIFRELTIPKVIARINSKYPFKTYHWTK